MHRGNPNYGGKRFFLFVWFSDHRRASTHSLSPPPPPPPPPGKLSLTFRLRSEVLPFVQRRLMWRYRLWCTALWSATARQRFSSWRCSKKQSRWQRFQALVLKFACTCILHPSFIYFACVIRIQVFMIICGLKNSRNFCEFAIHTLQNILNFSFF